MRLAQLNQLFDETGMALTVTDDGAMYLVGSTISEDFPVGQNVFQSNRAEDGDICQQRPIAQMCGDSYVLHIASTGEFVNATYLGGGWFDVGLTVNSDNKGNIIVAGFTGSSDFPTTANTNQDQPKDLGQITDVTITVISRSDFSIRFSSYFGGSSREYIHKILIDDVGHYYLTAWTQSTNFSTTSDAQHTEHQGGVQDIYLTKFSLDFEE